MSVRVLILLLVLSISPSLAQNTDWEKTRAMAESQHEIVMLLIEKQDFDKVLDAAKQIFSLPFPKEEEHRVVKEAQLLNDALLEHQRYDVAHQILDAAIHCVQTNKSKSELYREKAWLFKKEGKSEEALRSFEKSVELQKEDGS